MRELEVLDGGHLKLCWEERKAFFEEELGEQVRGEVKRLLEEALEAERTDWLGVGRYVRGGAARLSQRVLPAGLGDAAGVVERAAGAPAAPGLSEPVAGPLPATAGVGERAGARGFSARHLDAPGGRGAGTEAYSAQTVSRIVQGLDRAVAAYHRRRLHDEYVYLFLDGVVLKVRDNRGRVRRSVS